MRDQPAPHPDDLNHTLTKDDAYVWARVPRTGTRKVMLMYPTPSASWVALSVSLRFPRLPPPPPVRPHPFDAALASDRERLPPRRGGEPFPEQLASLGDCARIRGLNPTRNEFLIFYR